MVKREKSFSQDMGKLFFFIQAHDGLEEIPGDIVPVSPYSGRDLSLSKVS